MAAYFVIAIGAAIAAAIAIGIFKRR